MRDACDRHGALLIIDEIPSGLGRAGHLFSCDAFGVVPNILVLGKGLGGGVMPLAAVIAREELHVAGTRAIGHLIHAKNPVACGAGMAVLDELEERDLPGRARELGSAALERLRTIAQRHPPVGEVRGMGLLLGAVLAPHADGTPAIREAERVMYAALSRGLSFKVTMGDVLQLTPPLTVSEDELIQALTIRESAITDVETGWATSGPTNHRSAVHVPIAILRDDAGKEG